MWIEEDRVELWKTTLLPQFLDETASRLVDLEIERSILQEGGCAIIAAQKICAIAHKISGTAETFGFPDLGQQASATEALCRTLLNPAPTCISTAEKENLLAAVEYLIYHLDQTLCTPL